MPAQNGGSSSNAFDVLVRFVVDKQTLQDVRNGTKDLSGLVNSMGDSGTLLTLAAARLQPVMDAQIRKTAELQNAWWKTQRVLRASGFVFQEMAKIGLLAVGPFIASAVAFAKEAENMKKLGGEMDPVAAKWIEMQESLKKSTLSVGKTTATVLMPYLTQLAEIAAKGAAIVEQHPEIIEAALKIGAAVLTVGTLGKLATDGLKMVVDMKFVSASATNMLAGEAMIKAAATNLEAAVLMAAGGDYYGAQGMVLDGPIVPMSASNKMMAGLSKVFANTSTKAGMLLLNASAGIANVLTAGASKLKGTLPKMAAAIEKMADGIWTAGIGASGKISSAGTKMAAAASSGALLTGIQYAAVTAAALYVGAQIGKAVGNYLAKQVYGENYKDQEIGNAAQTWARMFSVPGQALALWLNEIGVLSDDAAFGIAMAVKRGDEWLANILGLTDASDEAAEATDGLTVALKGHADEIKIVEAYTKMLKENREAETKLAEDILNTKKDADKKLAKSARDYAKDVARITSDLTRDLLKMASDAAKENAKADREHAAERRTIARDGGLEIQRIEEDHQRNLLKMQQEHDQRIADLVGERDALGIVEEDRKYALEVANANEETNTEIARRRQDIAIRLADLDASYQEERRMRAEELAAKMQEARDKAKQELTEKAAAYAEEQKAIREERAAKIRELIDQAAKEKAKRREAFLDMVRDIDAALLGEQQLKQAYYDAMLKDAEAFLAKYRASLPSGSTLPTGSSGSLPGKAKGNYVSGPIMTGEEGAEFLLTNRSTRLAEQAVGGRLTQESLLNRLAGGSTQHITIQMGNGMTVSQVTRMLTETQNAAFRDLAHALGA